MKNNIMARLGTLEDFTKKQVWKSESLRENIQKKIQFLNSIDRTNCESYLIDEHNPFDFFCELIAHIVSKNNVLILDSSDRYLLKDRTFAKHTNPTEPAITLKTSGTTGKAKFIQITWACLLKKIEFLEKKITEYESEVTLCALKLSFGHGLIGCFLFPLLTGKKVCYVPPTLGSYLNLFQIANESNVTFISATPHIFKIATSRTRKPLPNPKLMRIQTASSEASIDTINTMRSYAPEGNIVQAYGMTEFASWISFYSYLKAEINPRHISPPSLQKWLLIDPVKENIVEDEGELIIEERYCCQRNSNLTYIEINGISYLRTRDYVKHDKKSQAFEICGRTDDLLDYNGVKFYPQEIENRIRETLNQSLEIMVCLENNLLVLKIVANETSSLEIKLNKALSKIEVNKRPLKIIFVEKLPRNDNGKLLRRHND